MSDRDLNGGLGARTADVEPLLREVEAVLGRRVDDVERENRDLRHRVRTLTLATTAALILSVGAVTWALTAGTRVAPAVHARQFVLHDADGTVRGGLGMTPEGGSRLVLKDRTGHERLRLTLLADGSPGLSFADADSRSRIVLGFLPDETANLVLADRFGRTRAVFGLLPDESSTLVFADRNGQMRVGLGIDPRGDAGLTLFERNGRTTAPPVDSAAVADTAASQADARPKSR